MTLHPDPSEFPYLFLSVWFTPKICVSNSGHSWSACSHKWYFRALVNIQKDPPPPPPQGHPVVYTGTGLQFALDHSLTLVLKPKGFTSHSHRVFILYIFSKKINSMMYVIFSAKSYFNNSQVLGYTDVITLLAFDKVSLNFLFLL